MNLKNFGRKFPLLKQILNSLTELHVMVLNSEGKVLLFNSGSRELVNFRDDEIEGQHVKNILSKANEEDTIEKFFPESNGRPLSVETYLKTNKNGSKKLSWRVIKNPSRRETNGLAVCIEESSIASNGSQNEVRYKCGKAKKTAEKYKTLFEYAYDAILFSRFETGRLFEVNPEAESLLGFSTEELLDRSLTDLLTREDFESLKTRLEQDNFFYRENQILNRNDGSEIVASMSAALIEYEGDKTILSLFRDMTRRIELEEKLRKRAANLKESNEKLEEIIQIISHDLKEPLRSIGTYSDMLKAQNEEELSQNTIKKLAKLKRNASRLKEMLDDVSNLTKITVNDSPTLVEMGDLVEEITGELALNQSSAEISLQNCFPKVKFDRFQLKVLIKNLISNALKYNSKPKRVEIGYREKPEGEKLIGFVRDNGRGIPEEYRNKIFKMFEQLEPNRNQIGMGAGLAFCKRIVNGHGGKIWLESEVGKGSTFYFTIPKG